MFGRNPCYKSPSTLEQNDIIALLSLFLILNIFHTLFQCLSMYLIAGFDISYFSRFQIKMNSSLIVYSFLERISTKCNANPLASSSKQVFITNFNANCNVIANYFLSSLSFDKEDKKYLILAQIHLHNFNLAHRIQRKKKEKKKTLFESYMKLCNMRLEKIKI